MERAALAGERRRRLLFERGTAWARGAARTRAALPTATGNAVRDRSGTSALCSPRSSVPGGSRAAARGSMRARGGLSATSAADSAVSAEAPSAIPAQPEVRAAPRPPEGSARQHRGARSGHERSSERRVGTSGGAGRGGEGRPGVAALRVVMHGGALRFRGPISGSAALRADVRHSGTVGADRRSRELMSVDRV